MIFVLVEGCVCVWKNFKRFFFLFFLAGNVQSLMSQSLMRYYDSLEDKNVERGLDLKRFGGKFESTQR